MKIFKKALCVLFSVIIAASAFVSGFAYTHNPKFNTGYDIIDVIDVSSHNDTIDWAKVAASGIKEAIIRVGYRGNTEGNLFLDKKFEENVSGALAAGLKIGVYFYTQAISLSEAEEEAKFVINAIKGKNITLPVIFDCEYAEKGGKYVGRLYDARLANFYLTSICAKFLDTIKSAGYQPMLYANKFMLNDKLNARSLESKYPIWLAQYDVDTPTYDGEYIMWQYTPNGKVDGIKGKVDMSFRYQKKAETPASVEYIKVSAAKTQLTVGETVQAVAKTDANALAAHGKAEAVVWESTAPSVAKVDANGVVTAFSEGSAEIIASVKVTGEQGSKIFNDKLAFTVNAAQIIPTDPTNPTEPTNPTDPTDPTNPADPAQTEPTEDDPLMNFFIKLGDIIVFLINLFGKLIKMFG